MHDHGLDGRVLDVVRRGPITANRVFSDHLRRSANLDDIMAAAERLRDKGLLILEARASRNGRLSYTLMPVKPEATAHKTGAPMPDATNAPEAVDRFVNYSGAVRKCLSPEWLIYRVWQVNHDVRRDLIFRAEHLENVFQRPQHAEPFLRGLLQRGCIRPVGRDTGRYRPSDTIRRMVLATQTGVHPRDLSADEQPGYEEWVRWCRSLPPL